MLDNFPQSNSQGDALSLLVLSQRALENNMKAQEALALLQKYFPDHKALKSGEFESPFIDKKRLWVQLITLGFLS